MPGFNGAYVPTRLAGACCAMALSFFSISPACASPTQMLTGQCAHLALKSSDIIKTSTFPVNLPPYGNVCFVTHKIKNPFPMAVENGLVAPGTPYLSLSLYKNGRDIDDFTGPHTPWVYWDTPIDRIVAVSFQKLPGDHFVDAFIIGESTSDKSYHPLILLGSPAGFKIDGNATYESDGLDVQPETIPALLKHIHKIGLHPPPPYLLAYDQSVPETLRYFAMKLTGQCANLDMPSENIIKYATSAVDLAPYGDVCFVAHVMPDPTYNDQWEAMTTPYIGLSLYKNGHDIYNFNYREAVAANHPGDFYSLGDYVVAVAFRSLPGQHFTDILVIGHSETLKGDDVYLPAIYLGSATGFRFDEPLSAVLLLYNLPTIPDLLKTIDQIGMNAVPPIGD